MAKRKPSGHEKLPPPQRIVVEAPRQKALPQQKFLIWLGSVAGAIVAIVTAWNLLGLWTPSELTGSDRPPFVGRAAFQPLPRLIGELTDQVKLFKLEDSQRDCDDQNERLRTVEMRLATDPNDTFFQDRKREIEARVRGLRATIEAGGAISRC